MQYAYKPEELERLKKTEMEVLAAFIEICEKHDLPYFLNGGTAIGAVRHQGFIPWDDDMDVGMLRDDYEKFLQVAPKEMEGKFELMNAEINKDCPGYTMRMCKVGTKHITDEHSKYPTTFGIRIDIFPYDNVPEDPKLRKSSFGISTYTTACISCVPSATRRCRSKASRARLCRQDALWCITCSRPLFRWIISTANTGRPLFVIIIRQAWLPLYAI